MCYAPIAVYITCVMCLHHMCYVYSCLHHMCYVPIAVYITCVMFLAGLSLVSTVLVLRLHHSQSTVPNWLYNFTTSILSRAVCLTLPSNNKLFPDDVTQPPSPPDVVKYKGVNDVIAKSRTMNIISQTGCLRVQPHSSEASRDPAVSNQLPPRDPAISNQLPPRDPAVSNQLSRIRSEMYEVLESVTRLTSALTDRLEREKKGGEKESRWRDIARVFDKLFLIVHVFLTISLAVFLLGIYPQVGPKNWQPLR